MSGPVTLTVATAPGVSWCNYYVDGNCFASTPPNSISWDSSKVANGIHTIAANAYSSSRALLGISSVTVSVLNPVISVSPASALKITAPTAGSQISGSILIAANQPAGVTWENFYIDGNWIASSPPFSFNWNSKQISNGTHTISVTSYGNSGKIGSSSLSVTIARIGSLDGTLPPPTPIATAAPTIAPTAVATPAPSKAPTTAPTIAPTAIPTKAPTIAPTAVPSGCAYQGSNCGAYGGTDRHPHVNTYESAHDSTNYRSHACSPTVVPTRSANHRSVKHINKHPDGITPTLLTPATYFVSIGSDGNNGMSLANAWRTIPACRQHDALGRECAGRVEPPTPSTSRSCATASPCRPIRTQLLPL